MPNTFETYLTIEECAKRTMLGTTWWRRVISTRQIATVKFGGAVRIPESELVALVNAGYRPPIHRGIDTRLLRNGRRLAAAQLEELIDEQGLDEPPRNGNIT